MHRYAVLHGLLHGPPIGCSLHQSISSCSTMGLSRDYRELMLHTWSTCHPPALTLVSAGLLLTFSNSFLMAATQDSSLFLKYVITDLALATDGSLLEMIGTGRVRHEASPVLSQKSHLQSRCYQNFVSEILYNSCCFPFQYWLTGTCVCLSSCIISELSLKHSTCS